MIIREVLHKGDELSTEQIKRLESLKDMPILYDEDSLRLTPELKERFRQAAKERNARKRLSAD